MGRPLRSGRVLKSISPDKRSDEAAKGKKSTRTPAKKHPVKATPAKPAARRGVKKTSAKAAPRGRKRQAKEESESEEDVKQMDVDSEEESEDVEVPKAKAKKVASEKKTNTKQSKEKSEESKNDNSGSEDESEDAVKKAASTPIKKAKSPAIKKDKPAAKKEESSDEEESEDGSNDESEDEVVKAARTHVRKAKSPADKKSKYPAKKEDSSDEDESEDGSNDESADELVKAARTPVRKAKSPADKKAKSPAKKEDSSDEEESEDGSDIESEDDVEKAAPAPVKKAKSPANKKAKSPAMKDQSSDEEESEDGSDKVEKAAPTPVKKAIALSNNKAKTPAKEDKEESEDGSDEESDDVPTPAKEAKVPSNNKAKTPAKEDQEESEDGSDDESEDEVEMVAPTPLKKTKSPAKQESSGDEESEDESANGSDVESEDEADDKGFTDENAKWLKPKTKIALMSSDEEDNQVDEFGEHESDDEENMLEVERQSRLIDAEMAAEQEEADMEMRRTIAQETAVFHLPTPEELEEDENRVVPPSELRARIEDILEVLADFKVRREPNRSRSEYIERLGKDMAELFGYLQELVDYFLSMFGPNECFEFLEASDKPRPLVVRVNTLKARRKDLAAALMKRGVRLDPLAPWSKVGLKIYESTVPIGATPEYLAGHYMLQSAASMCPVMALGPQPGDRVMDMSAAPGGKTSYLSQLMKNKGVVIANDLKAERQKATVANLHRLGVRNVVTCCYDGRKIGGQLRNSFDRILLDAPCSGLGVISRDPSVKVQRTIPDVQRCAHLQKELLLAAVDALNHKSKKGGGFMVYSTCSVAVAENEEVVNYLLSKRDVKLVETGLDFGKPGFTRFEHKRFHPSLALTRRFYPHVHNMDGFYVAKIQKLSDKRKGEDDKKQAAEEGVTDDVKVTEPEEDVKKPAVVVDDDSEKRHSKKRGKGKKRGKESYLAADDQNKAQKKRSKISYPAVQPQQKKKKTNAKVSKPRRVKINGM